MMKISMLAVTAVLLLAQASSTNAFVAPQFPAVKLDRVGGVSPLLSKATKEDTSVKPELDDKLPSTRKKRAIVKPVLARKKWGVDKDGEEDEYWFNQKIHTLGNTGFTGAIHAAISPISTFMIDAMAYDGVDIRHKVAAELAEVVHLNQGRILDLCCGVGMSTRALQDAFPTADQVIGVDTSPEMISMANVINIQDSILAPFVASVKAALKRLDGNLQNQYNSMQHKSMEIKQAASLKMAEACSRHTSFATGNAENTPYEPSSFDLITIMYGFHEIPKKGRDTILREARRLLRKGGVLALIDIAPDYQPSSQMLAGEPYVLEYKEHIDKQLRKFAGFIEREKTLVPGHVKMWVLQRA